MIHAFQLLFIDCNYPKAFVWWIGLHAVMFYSLFSDFYKQAYKKKQASTVITVILVLLFNVIELFKFLLPKQQYVPFRAVVVTLPCEHCNMNWFKL